MGMACATSLIDEHLISVNPDALPAQAILFDIGNVLLRFDFDRAAEAMAGHSKVGAAQIRAELDAWQVRHESGAVTSEAFGAAVRQAIGYGGSEALFREQFCDIFQPNEPMWSFARSLFGQVPVYLFSNISLWHETWIFERYADFARFDGGFYSWRLGVMKPEAGFYRAAAEALPFAPGRIAYLDDMPLNVAGGQDSGFRVHHYHHEAHAAFLATAAQWLG